MNLLAIDPGNIYSGYVLMDEETYRPIESGKIENAMLLYKIRNGFSEDYSHVAIEMIASYGMPVGAEVFDTCVWIGRFFEAITEEVSKTPVDPSKVVSFIYRKEEKSYICNDSRAKDVNIKCALVERFARGQSNYGKGTKSDPGWFYGFKADIWQAYAVGTTYLDKKKFDKHKK